MHFSSPGTPPRSARCTRAVHEAIHELLNWKGVVDGLASDLTRDPVPISEATVGLIKKTTPTASRDSTAARARLAGNRPVQTEILHDLTTLWVGWKVRSHTLEMATV